MKVMVTGHREEKLVSYDRLWIQQTIDEQILSLRDDAGMSLGLSGMASGVDLWFCHSCLDHGLPYHACVPFEGQEDYMAPEAALYRQRLLERAAEVKRVRNRHMVESCDAAVVVWDGNKGGTHNCLQQLLEAGKPIRWLVPQRKKVVEI